MSPPVPPSLLTGSLTRADGQLSTDEVWVPELAPIAKEKVGRPGSAPGQGVHLPKLARWRLATGNCPYTEQSERLEGVPLAPAARSSSFA